MSCGRRHSCYKTEGCGCTGRGRELKVDENGNKVFSYFVYISYFSYFFLKTGVLRCGRKVANFVRNACIKGNEDRLLLEAGYKNTTEDAVQVF